MKLAFRYKIPVSFTDCFVDITIQSRVEDRYLHDDQAKMTIDGVEGLVQFQRGRLQTKSPNGYKRSHNYYGAVD